jgi:hypothetical protein
MILLATLRHATPVLAAALAAVASVTRSAGVRLVATSLPLQQQGPHQPASSFSSAATAAMSSREFYGQLTAPSGVLKYYCNGQWLESSSGKSVPVINPSTQEKDYAVQGEREGGDQRPGDSGCRLLLGQMQQPLVGLTAGAPGAGSPGRCSHSCQWWYAVVMRPLGDALDHPACGDRSSWRAA